MSKYQAILTDVGEKLINAAYAAGETIDIKMIEFGDGSGSYVTPDPSAQNLVNKWGEQTIQKGKSTDAAISILVRIDSDMYNGKFLREFGLRDTNGNLIVIANYPVAEVVANQPFPIEVGCDMYIENASTVNIIVETPYGGTAFPINATLALKSTDELYTDENGCSWLKSGCLRYDIENFPLATVSEKESDNIVKCELSDAVVSATKELVSTSTNQFGSILFFIRNRIKTAYKLDFDTNTEEEFSLPESTTTHADITARDESTLYIMDNGVITEYDGTFAETGNVINISNVYRRVVYARYDDELGSPVFYALTDSDTPEIYEVSNSGETLKCTLPSNPGSDHADEYTYRDIAYFPSSDSIELVGEAYTMFVGSTYSITSIELDSGNVIRNTKIDEPQASEWAIVDCIYYDSETTLHAITADGSGTLSPSTYWTVENTYEIKGAVGLENESFDPVTNLPIYIRVS